MKEQLEQQSGYALKLIAFFSIFALISVLPELEKYMRLR